MADIAANALPEKLTPPVSWDKLVMGIDSEDGNKVKIVDALLFKWPVWNTWVTGSQWIQGNTWATGSQWIQWNTGATGVAWLIWKDVYVWATAYIIDDAVSYNGSSYMCILNSTGNLPTNVTYWSVLSAKWADWIWAWDMLSTNNLSDIVDAPTSRINLWLWNVDNTTDLLKPISTATQNALNNKQVAWTYASWTWSANWTNTGDQTTISWNSWTATALQTARTINWVAFNWTTNITVPSNIAPWIAWNVLTSNWGVWTSATPGWWVSEIFDTYLSINPSLTTTVTTLPFNSVNIDSWINFNVWTYQYTAPTTWNYVINFNARYINIVSWDLINYYIYKNWGQFRVLQNHFVQWTGGIVSVSIVVNLTSWDTLDIRAQNGSATRGLTGWTNPQAHFSWYKL